MLRTLRLILALLCLSLAAAGTARAHATLAGSDPADGAVMPAAPSGFALAFSEPVSPLVLKLIGPDGTARPLERFSLADRRLLIEAPAGLGEGTHVLSWRVVSQDGHPVGGSVLFSIGAPSQAPAQAADQGDRTVSTMLWLGKTGLYLAVFLGVGGIGSILWVGPLPPRARRPLAWLIGLGLLSLPLAFAAQGLDALALPPSRMLAPAAWRAAAASSFGWTALLAAAALALGLPALRADRRAGLVLAAASLLCLGAALAASGHAAAAAPQMLMRPAVFLHALGIAGWAGALLPLALALQTQGGEAALARFSRRIPLVLALILISGAGLAIVQVERPAALVETAYGRVLLAKLALVALLLALAALNRFRLTGAAACAAGAKRLRLSIAAEIALILAIFGTAALWRFTPPPRALAAAAQAQAINLHIHTEQAMGDISLASGRVGPVAITISLLNGEFGPLPAQELRVSLANPAAGIEPIERQAVAMPDGGWQVSGLSLPAAGRWTLELEILVSDFEMIRLRDTIEIRP
jgi:copper transport protein